MNTWVSFQSAEQPLLGQFSVSGNTQKLICVLLPVGRNGDVEDEYTSFGVSIKIRTFDIS
ncbi:OprD family porin [Pseudomonas cerasi]|uniref:OprD family porin n=1 Tax=Pseudomonas cerasi TaxID=1583341 RepID=UPI0013904C09|nr:OprD family porin [Pseudomonas cerasi]